MIYRGDSYLIQKKDFSFTYVSGGHLTRLKTPIHIIDGNYKPIGPTMLVEWTDD